MAIKWFDPHNKVPEDGQLVTWIDSGGEETDGKYENGSWWIPTRSGWLYTYYEPVFWKFRE